MKGRKGAETLDHSREAVQPLSKAVWRFAFHTAQLLHCWAIIPEQRRLTSTQNPASERFWS